MPNKIKWDECKRWPTSQGLENFLGAEDDIVIALDRPWINGGSKVGIIKAEDLPCLLIQRTARIRTNSVLPQYLILLLKHQLLKWHCDITEMTVPHISHKDRLDRLLSEVIRDHIEAAEEGWPDADLKYDDLESQIRDAIKTAEAIRRKFNRT